MSPGTTLAVMRVTINLFNMKLLNSISAKLTVLFLSLLTTVMAFAQEGGGSGGGGTDINVYIVQVGGGVNWYALPWVCIVSTALFILLLLALLQRNNTCTDA